MLSEIKVVLPNGPSNSPTKLCENYHYPYHKQTLETFLMVINLTCEYFIDFAKLQSLTKDGSALLAKASMFHELNISSGKKRYYRTATVQ
ncbi:unnamed protein product, partial [Cylicostephanus goldi]